MLASIALTQSFGFMGFNFNVHISDEFYISEVTFVVFGINYCYKLNKE